MRMFAWGQDLTFWIVVAVATMLRLALSKYHNVMRSLATIASALFAAKVFTEPLLDILNLSPDKYSLVIAALMALIGEGVMRTVIAISIDPKEAGALWRQMRGKGHD